MAVWDLARGDAKELGLQVFSDRATAAAADSNAIDRTDRRDLGCSTTKEHLVC
jgi:hypothetical protein